MSFSTLSSEHQTRLDALMMTLSVGYLLPWPGAGGRGQGRPQESPGARRIAAGSRSGEEEREGEVGAELVGRWVE